MADYNRNCEYFKYLPLVKWVVYQITQRLPKHVEANDLLSVGLQGLLKAMENYDPNRSNKFETYAVIVIRGAILDELRAVDWVPRSIRDKASALERAKERLRCHLGREPTDQELASELELTDEAYQKLLQETRPATLLALEEAPQLGDADESVEKNETYALLAQAIKALPKQERKVVQLYYYKQMTLKKIGAKMGVGESRISQIHSAALSRLKSFFDERT